MDIYQTITDRMSAEMEQGMIPWHKPWMAAGAAISHTTGKAYSLLNQMLLGRAGEYLTFKQVQAEGGCVRKGEKAKMVVFWKFIEKEDEETGEITQVPFLKYYNVFHVDQCEGISAKHVKPLAEVAEADAEAETIIADYVKREGVTIENLERNKTYDVSFIIRGPGSPDPNKKLESGSLEVVIAVEPWEDGGDFIGDF